MENNSCSLDLPNPENGCYCGNNQTSHYIESIELVQRTADDGSNYFLATEKLNNGGSKESSYLTLEDFCNDMNIDIKILR